MSMTDYDWQLKEASGKAVKSKVFKALNPIAKKTNDYDGILQGVHLVFQTMSKDSKNPDRNKWGRFASEIGEVLRGM